MSSKRVSASEGVAADERSTNNKRRRSNNDDDEPRDHTTVSFTEDINDDCKVLILSFLEAEDMNSFAICSQDCRRVRRHESLDQTRTATLCLTEETTPRSLSNKIRENQHVFTGNRSRLKVVGLKRVKRRPRWPPVYNQVFLPQVTSLDCSFLPTSELPTATCSILLLLGNGLPSLRKLDLRDVSFNHSDFRGASMRRGIISSFSSHHHALTQITWKEAKGLEQCGYEFTDVRSLSYLYMDKAVFSREAIFSETIDRFRRTNDPLNDIPNFYMFMHCKTVQCLSLKGATLMVSDTETVPLPQEMLLTLVRRHPTLRWLKSDLTTENVQMLQQEKPDFMFAS